MSWLPLLDNVVWKDREPIENPPPNSIDNYSVGTHQTMQEICHRRNYLTVNKMCDSLVGIENPHNANMYAKAVEIIAEAINLEKTIVIFGDFDVDGTTATASLGYAIATCGGVVRYALANRLAKGHGIDVEKIQDISKPGSLVITVDNGINCVEEVKQLQDLGYQVIVTDHHTPDGEDVVKTDIINPKLQLPETDPEFHAPGVYVAAKLGIRIAHKFNKVAEIHEYENTMVALGIISDVIPLNDWMRQQLRYGLVCLNNIEHDGLRALYDICWVNKFQPLTARFLAYVVVPKINAAGRMNFPERALQLLLLDKDPSPIKQKAKLLAMELKHLNEDRKVLEEGIYDSIQEQLKVYDTLPLGMVFRDESWHPGVIGVVAARVSEENFRPVILLSKNQDGIWIGSGRSHSGDFNLYAAIEECKDLLLGFGGHIAAAGLQIEERNIPLFEAAFSRAAKKQMDTIRTEILVDAETDIRTLNDPEFLISLFNIEPIGKDNPDLHLKLSNVTVLSKGVKKHTLQIAIVDDKGEYLTVSKFRSDEDSVPCQVGDTIDLLVIPNFTYFSGITLVEWQIRDVKIRRPICQSIQDGTKVVHAEQLQ